MKKLASRCPMMSIEIFKKKMREFIKRKLESIGGKCIDSGLEDEMHNMKAFEGVFMIERRGEDGDL